MICIFRLLASRMVNTCIIYLFYVGSYIFFMSNLRKVYIVVMINSKTFVLGIITTIYI